MMLAVSMTAMAQNKLHLKICSWSIDRRHWSGMAASVPISTNLIISMSVD